jgi:hypothetical protein
MPAAHSNDCHKPFVQQLVIDMTNFYTEGVGREGVNRTAGAGLLYGINPLDQPSVEIGKRLAIDYLRGAAR